MKFFCPVFFPFFCPTFFCPVFFPFFCPTFFCPVFFPFFCPTFFCPVFFLFFCLTFFCPVFFLFFRLTFFCPVSAEAPPQSFTSSIRPFGFPNHFTVILGRPAGSAAAGLDCGGASSSRTAQRSVRS